MTMRELYERLYRGKIKGRVKTVFDPIDDIPITAMLVILCAQGTISRIFEFSRHSQKDYIGATEL
jgi:hypothetical protein